MKKRYQVIGFVFLMICSVIYDYQQPEVVLKKEKTVSYVILEGAFLKQGKYEFEGEKTIEDVVLDVGVQSHANLNALSLKQPLKDETTIYLPVQSNDCISLNHSSKEELMTLDRIGEKTAQKIIEYRTHTPFTCLEDIMNVQGIGEKTYMRLREHLCL